MSVPHPFPYQGSKRNLATFIISFLPQDINRLIEPFAGSAALSLSAAYNQKATKFIINDLNKPLIDLWEQIINNPIKIVNQYQELWLAQDGIEKAFYDNIRNEFNKTYEPRYLYYLLARCVKAAVRYNNKGEFNQGPDNRRKGAQPSYLLKHVSAASALLINRTTLTSLDYIEVLKLVDEYDVVYMDPPYQGVSESNNRRYIQGVEFESFVDALNSLNAKNISYIISYDGKKGNKTYGQILPEKLKLKHIEIDAGLSSQSTLLGLSEKTIESLYLSPSLVKRISFEKCTPSILEQLDFQLKI